MISIVCCLVLMMGLPLMTWLRFFSWLAIGLVIYFGYSKARSPLANPA
jgi:APA family basic amino acid/polyamine antiporter